jgi:hypothetical protein
MALDLLSHVTSTLWPKTEGIVVIPDVRELARALDEKVMRPIRPLWGDARLILLSPDGPLNLIPFGVLVDRHRDFDR